jgi:hypothetical protein
MEIEMHITILMTCFNRKKVILEGFRLSFSEAH